MRVFYDVDAEEAEVVHLPAIGIKAANRLFIVGQQVLHMETMRMPKELRPPLSFAEGSEQDRLVFTEKRQPVAALVSLRNVDRESLSLSTNPEFWRIIETSRKLVRVVQMITLEDLERKYGVSVPNRALRRTAQRRRRR